jgi:DNA-binding response OmpR family regulator
VPRVLVSNNSELLRHLSASPFRRLELDVIVAASGDEALATIRSEKPALAILDAELPGLSGYDVARQVKAIEGGGCRVVLVLGKRINADLMRRVADCECDEVLIAPMSADELYDAVAIQLGTARRGAERFHISLAVISADSGLRAIEGQITNLSLDGARLVVPEPLAEDTVLHLTITTGTEAEPIRIRSRVIWAQQRGDRTVVGAAFDNVDEITKSRLARLTQWEIIDDTAQTRVVLKGDFTEATSFDDLLPLMVGRVDFDLSQVRYMNSLGVREWCNFLRRAPIQGYEFHACSISFVLQASMVEDVLGRGTVASFFAPYHCDSCEHSEERLLQSAAILACDCVPPVFSCTNCEAGEMHLDDLPERYFAFLRR